MVATVLVAAAIMAIIHLYYFNGKSGKIDWVYFCVLLAVMGLNTQNADYIPYEEIYNNVAGKSNLSEALGVHYDKGYILLNWIAATIGFGFAEFHFLCYAALLGIMFYTVRCIGAPACVFYLAYMTYPMFMDTIQLRNFAVSVMFLFSIYCYSHSSLKWYIAGIVVSLLAVSIQPMSLIFLLFIAFYFIHKSKRLGRITNIFITLGVFSFIIKKVIDTYWTEIMSALYVLTSMVSRGAVYIGNPVLPSRLMKIYLVVLVFTCILYYVKKHLLSVHELNGLQKEFIQLSFVAFLYLICWMPVFALSIDFATRFPRDFFLLAYIVLGIYIQRCNDKQKKMGILLLTVFVAYFFGLVDLYIASLRFNVDLILNNNFLL